MSVRRRLYQLHGDSDRVTAFLDGTFEDVGDPELTRYFRKIFRRAFVMLRRCPRNDFQIGHLSQARQDLVLNAIGEISIGLFFAAIFKRQHRDAFLWNNCCTGSPAHYSAAEKDKETTGKRER